jgi:hypothetical protein
MSYCKHDHNNCIQCALELQTEQLCDSLKRLEEALSKIEAKLTPKPIEDLISQGPILSPALVRKPPQCPARRPLTIWERLSGKTSGAETRCIQYEGHHIQHMSSSGRRWT